MSGSEKVPLNYRQTEQLRPVMIKTENGYAYIFKHHRHSETLNRTREIMSQNRETNTGTTEEIETRNTAAAD